MGLLDRFKRREPPGPVPEEKRLPLDPTEEDIESAKGEAAGAWGGRRVGVGETLEPVTRGQVKVYKEEKATAQTIRGLESEVKVAKKRRELRQLQQEGSGRGRRLFGGDGEEDDGGATYTLKDGKLRRVGGRRKTGLFGSMGKEIAGGAARGAVVLGGMGGRRGGGVAAPSVIGRSQPTKGGLYDFSGLRNPMAPHLTGGGGRQAPQTSISPLRQGTDLSALRGAVTTSAMPRETVLPRGWSKEMGAAYQEIRENGDVDNKEHIMDELEQMGISRMAAGKAIARLVKKGVVVKDRATGEYVTGQRGS